MATEYDPRTGGTVDVYVPGETRHPRMTVETFQMLMRAVMQSRRGESEKRFLLDQLSYAWSAAERRTRLS